MLYSRTGQTFLSACLVFLLMITGCASSKPALENEKSPYIPVVQLEKEDILHVPTGIKVKFDSLMDVLSPARVIYVGESHDNIEHHRVQLDILRGLEARFPGGIAVGMEMFTTPSQAVLDRWVKGEISEKELFGIWSSNWGFDYEYYKPVLEFVREKRIPLVALSAPKEQARDLSKKGISGLSEQERKALPEIDDKDPYYRETVEAIFSDHSHGSGFERFFQVQLLWDETMAQGVAEFLKAPANKGKKMVVLAGGGHVQYGLGIPKRVFRRVPANYAIVLPITPRLYSLEKAGGKNEGDEKGGGQAGPRMMNIDMPDLPLLVADFLWAVDYKTLEGMRVMMGIQVAEEGDRVKVLEVAQKSAAERAGLQAGDFVMKLDNEEIKNLADLTFIMRRKKVGDTLRVTAERAGTPMSFAIEFKDTDQR